MLIRFGPQGRVFRLCALIGFCILTTVLLIFVSKQPPAFQRLPYVAPRLPPRFWAGVTEAKRELGLRERIQKTLSSNFRRHYRYPRRKNMGSCPPKYGNVGVFVAVDPIGRETMYKVAQMSLQCYLRSANYTYHYVDVMNDPLTAEHCNHTDMVFRKHCSASVYLKLYDWLLVLDADTGVVNPNHCIEEWIDDRVDMIFYERYYHFEIACGNYLVKNTPQVHEFLRIYADKETAKFVGFHASDNGPLQLLILRAAIPSARTEIDVCDKIYHEAISFETYLNYVTCVRIQLGAQRIFPGVLRILRRGHAWVRDAFLTINKFADTDFMFHGWKRNNLSSGGGNFEIPVFKEIPNPDECGVGMSGWQYRDRYYTTVDSVKKMLADYENFTTGWFPKEARDIPFLKEPDVGHCYPHCDDFT